VTERVLVAGIGNIFLGDDGFGVEVARRLAGEPPLPGVRVADFGIRGVHLAYELMNGYATVILVDATPRGGEPGSLYLIEPDLAELADIAARSGSNTPVMDAHEMTPDSVLALLAALGGEVGRVLVLGCEPARAEEGIGLSAPVSAAVDEAVRVVHDLAANAVDERSVTSTRATTNESEV
jgi:hydrogenase maturation protease